MKNAITAVRIKIVFNFIIKNFPRGIAFVFEFAAYTIIIYIRAVMRKRTTDMAAKRLPATLRLPR